MLNCESSEAKQTCYIVRYTCYIEEFEYRSEANRLDSDFVFKKTKKMRTFVFFQTKGKKRKGPIENYQSFAIPRQYYFPICFYFMNNNVHSIHISTTFQMTTVVYVQYMSAALLSLNIVW